MQRPFHTNGHLCKPFPSNLPQQLFQTIHIIKATPAPSWIKSNHIQHTQPNAPTIQSPSTVVPNNPYHQCKPSSIMDQVQSHPAYQTKCPSHPIPLNSCSKQSISSKQPQLYHGPSPITSSIILIGVTAPLLQATISISISQFISNPIIL